MRGVVPALLLLVAAGAASAAARPSERGCLLAWNAARNSGTRARVVQAAPSPRALLVPGIVGRDVIVNGMARPAQEAPACLLTLVRRGRIQVVSGSWRNGGVRSWTFGREISTSRPLPANVRLLRDGRVTKIYRR
jgi:hypothetical protein